MAETKAETKAKPWTEAEKLSVLFQIIESAPIPWDTLKLPEGRTKKAVQVMIDREKTKMRKNREAETGDRGGKGEADGEAAEKPKKGKRKADGEATTPKKAKAPRKKKAKASEDEGEGNSDANVVGVKAEAGDEEES